MQATIEKKDFLREIDVIEDREYILNELEKSKFEKSYSFEESYEYWMKYINNLQKKYDI